MKQEDKKTLIWYVVMEFIFCSFFTLFMYTVMCLPKDLPTNKLFFQIMVIFITFMYLILVTIPHLTLKKRD